MTKNRSEWAIGQSDDEELRNDLTTKNSDEEQRKNRSEWAIGRSESDLRLSQVGVCMFGCERAKIGN